jgi:Pyridoxamine 5'-phosphate oxidase
MPTQQGDLALLQDPVAQKLLQEQTILRLAYTWPDGTPRLVPHWFIWNGTEVVLGTQLDAPKVKALQQHPEVALTIDTIEFPPKVLLIRGTARVEIVDGVVPEFAESSRRYFGPEQGEAWVKQVGSLSPQMARIAITPHWVGILDYEQRFPSALERAMERAQANAPA